jgi:hypothetical protein
VPWTLAASGWTRADWDEDDPLSPAYILNKPEGTLKLTTSIPDTAVPVKNLTLSPFWREHSDIADGKLLVANRDHFIEIIDITRGEKIATIAVPLNYRYDISKPVNGKILLCGDDAFGVIDTTKGTQTPSWTTFPSGFTFHKMFSEPIDGKVLIASAKTTALLVDISQETPTVAVVQLPFSQAQTISAPVDGRMLIGSFYQSDTMAIIDVTQGAQTAEVVSMPMRIAWDTLSFPVNGKILVGGYSYTIAIVDLTQGTQTAAQVLMPAGPWTTFSLPVDGKILAISGNANLAVVVDLAQGAQTASTIINESDIYGVSDPAEGRLLVTGRNRFWILDMMGSPRLVKAINTPSSKQWATLSRPVNGRIFVAVNDEAFSTGLIIDLPAETMGVVTMPSSAIWNRLFDPVAGKILAGNSYDSYMAIIDLAQQTQIAAAVTLPSGSGTVLKSVPFGNKIAVCRMQSPSIAIVDITKGTQTAITIGIPAGSAGWTTIAGPAAGKFLVYNANDSSYLVVTVQLYPELRLLWNDDILSRIPLTQEVPYGFEG